MGDCGKDAAVNLFDARLAVDDHVVKITCYGFDDVPKHRVDLAVAAFPLWPANGEKGDVFPFFQGCKNLVIQGGQKCLAVFAFSLFDAADQVVANVVDGAVSAKSQSRCQTNGRIGVDGQYATF